MQFAYLWVLMFLVIPLALIVWEWQRRDTQVVMPLDHRPKKYRSGKGWRWMLNTAQCLPYLLLGVVVWILAGPQRLSDPKTKRALTNIQFCMDVSGSMMSQFGEGDRYDAAMESINEFINYREGDAFGLTVFGDHFIHWVPLTDDTTALKYAPPFLNPRTLPRWFSQGTSIGRALKECRKLMVQREEGDRMIILLSDGYSFDLSNGEDENLGREFRNDGIIVYAVHIGPGSPPPPLVNMSSFTGGEVFAAGDPEGLNAVFRRIDGMQKAKLEKTTAETMAHFRPYCLAGLAILGSLTLCGFGLRYTPW